ncbi:class I SAM-dependent RNA methyltransferase [Tropicimonas isoalkanivorans]|uniref:23S rRNA m(5)U-1939 methyltransferase n=1 Tax=Tropicimonas isoalkanivorans TaxID=441112 RepID=A0A1I1LYP0_9RHOB|nr:class I SAM-dependent RNA methyltransferase [Tropicimonas isoalkanivorans]SFC78231.1 23S rRNA m(5)U-1939 methyltransferase [Tropicimonas isoalkanivorans]
MRDVTIERLGHLGDGIAPGPIYAPRCLPGEVVTGTPEGDRLTDVRILVPSPHRVAPPCRHYAGCGGCAVQHAGDAFVAGWKEGIVRTALAAQGLETEFRPMHVSPPRTRRRAVFAGRRTKKGVLVGFHARASHTVIDVPGCQLVLPALLDVRPALEAITRAGASRKGELSLTVTAAPEGPDVAVSGGKPLDLVLRAQLGEIAGTYRLSRLTWDGELLAMEAAPTVKFDGIAVSPPPGAFLQATEDGEQALRAAVTEAVKDAEQIVDLFAGCGTFALPLARRASVHAVEGSRALTDALTAGWRQAGGLRPVTAETRDLFRQPLGDEELGRFDAIVIDPPRAGAEAQVEQIAASDISCVAAVSCNPATFARDAARLVRGGFRLDWVQVVDQFRWSPHVELAARLSRNHMGA